REQHCRTSGHAGPVSRASGPVGTRRGGSGMSWITRLRPKLNKFLQPRDTPDNLWHKCKSCGKMIFRKDFLADLSVCQNCGHHERVTASEHLSQVFDDC